MQIFKSPNFNFVRWRWHAIALSLIVIAIGAATIFTRGMPMGVEFAGGTIVIVQFEQEPDIGAIRDALAAGVPQGGVAIVQRYSDPSRNQVMIRVAEVGAETGGELSRTAESVVAALQKAGVGSVTPVGTRIVGPIVGNQLKRQGTLAAVLALLGILIYIAVRFRLGFAVGAVVATIHDVLVTLTFLSLFGYEMSLNVIAGILTIVGYSVNDTIVIFDRVRENLRSMRRDSLEHIVNLAVNQTLSRTVITAGTTLLALIGLYLFGGEVLEGFAFTMIVGVIAGTYSTVFIASAIAVMWQGRGPMKRQAVVSSSPAEQQPRRRRARAS